MAAEGTSRAAAQPDRAQATLKVHLLGRFEVVRGDAPIPARSWRRRRPADLLKLVALSPGRRIPRDRAADLLWPDKDPSSGANNLHRALYDLRQILGGRWVDLEHGVASLRPDVWLDVDAFEAAVAAGTPASLEGAVALYRGDLSPDDPESPWLAARRAELRRLFAGAGFPLARGAAARGDAAAAVPLLRRVLEVDPANEEAHRLLVRLLAESGRRADALRQYDLCEQALRAAGLAASPETRALREAVQRGEVGPTGARPPFDGWRRASRRLLGVAEPAPLRGRAGALILLESLVEQGAGALFLLGERGVGKTRLAVEGARLAQERGALVLAGIAGGPGAPPYSLLQSAWADYLETAGAPEPDPFAAFARDPSGSPEDRKRRLFEAVVRSLSSLAAGRPVYLLLEDVHAADESSANLVHYLARNARAGRLAMVATCREDEVRAGAPVHMLLSHLDAERLGRGVRVQRLGLEATREQLGDVLGQVPSPQLAAQIYRITDGSPFYTEEMARAFRDSGQLQAPDGPAGAVRARVARLGPKVQALLDAAAVAGRRFDFEVVRPVTGLTAHEALTALEQSLEAHLVEEEGAGHHFHHSLVRDALYEALPPPRRAELHRAVAAAIEARAEASGEVEEAAEVLAHHRRAAADLPAAWRHLVAAGHRAAARAGLSEALSFYGQAVELGQAASASGPECRELHEAMGRVQMELADLAGARRSFEALAAMECPPGERTPPEQRARAGRWSALALLAGGRPGEADRRLEEALGESPGGDEAAEALLLRSQIRWHAGAHAEAASLAERAAAEAATTGDAELGARAREAAALARASAGEAAAVEPADPGEEASQDAPFEVHLALFERDLGLGGRSLAEVAAAAALLGGRALRRGTPRAAAAAWAVEGALALAAGRLEVAEPALRDAAERHRALGSGLGEAFALERLGALLTARGRIEEALSVLGGAVLVAERAALRLHALTRVHVSLARNRLAAGGVYAAEDCVREASESAARHGDCAVCGALLRPEVVRVALARGRLDEAGAEADALGAAAGRAPGLSALALLSQGRVLAARGRTDEALVALAGAREAFLGGGAGWEAARCLAARARALEAAGAARAAEARGAREEARAALQAIGAGEADT